jgi:dihydrofolate reductase
MLVSIIAAVAQNGVIGRLGRLPWRLSADLQRFKRTTMGHTLVMGRRTWESIGRALPGRRTVVVTRRPGYRIEDASVESAASLEAALKLATAAGEREAFIVGGGELYREALAKAGRMYYTRVNANVDGDTYFPAVNWQDWRLIESEEHGADEKNEHAFAFEVYERS